VISQLFKFIVWVFRFVDWYCTRALASSSSAYPWQPGSKRTSSIAQVWQNLAHFYACLIMVRKSVCDALYLPWLWMSWAFGMNSIFFVLHLIF